MEQAQGYSRGKEERLRKEAKRGFIRRLTQMSFRYLLLATISVVFSLGVASLGEIVFLDQVPKVHELGILSPHTVMALSTTDYQLFSGKHWSSERCWAAVEPSLTILDHVCPEVSEWFRQKGQEGKIVWEIEDRGQFGRYDYVRGELVINKLFFTLNDGRRASIIAHEFRHSRQNVCKLYKALIANLLLKDPSSDIVETDAYLFEKEVLLAIFPRR